MFGAYWSDPAVLWRDPYHDRNTHYLNGLNLSLDLMALDPAAFISDAIADPIWPPLHAVALSVVLLIGGPDHRLAILPSLLGWCLTVLLTGLLAYRAAPSGMSAWFPPAVATTLAIGSPAFRLLGSDVMLEGLGAALSASALAVFMRCRAGPSGLWWTRVLAIVLTGLFFEKFNYWLLVVVPLGITAAVDRSGWLIATLRQARIKQLPGRMLWSWLGCLGIGAALLAIGLAMDDPRPITLLGRSYLLYPGLVLTAAWGMVLLRTCYVWRLDGVALRQAIGPAASILLGWHLLPVALWFLVPQALTRFIFFVGPTHLGATLGYDPWHALLFQWTGFSEGFHTPVIAPAILVLAGLGGWRLIRRAERGRCIAIYAALATSVLVLHPQQQLRFQATMLFAVWVCAGVGAAIVLGAFKRATRLPTAGPAVMVVGGLILLVARSPAPLARQVAIRTPDAPSDLSLAAAYLPLIEGAHRVGVATTFGVSDLFAWTAREACRCRVVIDQPWLQLAPNRAEAAAATATWLDHLQADRVLFIDMPAPYPLPNQPHMRDRLSDVGPTLAASPRLVALPGTPLAVDQAQVMAWRMSVPLTADPPIHLHLDRKLSLVFAGLVAALLLVPRRQQII